MSKKRHWAANAAFKNTPTRHELDKSVPPRPHPGTPIPCHKCGVVGHTLVKINDHYVHQNQELCNTFAVARLKQTVHKV